MMVSTIRIKSISSDKFMVVSQAVCIDDQVRSPKNHWVRVETSSAHGQVKLKLRFKSSDA